MNQVEQAERASKVINYIFSNKDLLPANTSLENINSVIFSILFNKIIKNDIFKNKKVKKIETDDALKIQYPKGVSLNAYSYPKQYLDEKFSNKEVSWLNPQQIFGLISQSTTLSMIDYAENSNFPISKTIEIEIIKRQINIYQTLIANNILLQEKRTPVNTYLNILLKTFVHSLTAEGSDNRTLPQIIEILSNVLQISNLTKDKDEKETDLINKNIVDYINIIQYLSAFSGYLRIPPLIQVRFDSLLNNSLAEINFYKKYLGVLRSENNFPAFIGMYPLIISNSKNIPLFEDYSLASYKNALQYFHMSHKFELIAIPKEQLTIIPMNYVSLPKTDLPEQSETPVVSFVEAVKKIEKAPRKTRAETVVLTPVELPEVVLTPVH
jgi:hypothetical protein